MIGSNQAEVERANADFSSPSMKGYQRLLDAFGPMAGYRVVEDYTRGIGIIGSEALARRYGLDPVVVNRTYQQLDAEFFTDWAKTIAAIRTKGTQERLQAIIDSETMFDYNALGEVPLFGGTLGKLTGRLTTFGANFFPRFVVRPVSGAAKTIEAAARAAIRLKPAPTGEQRQGEWFLRRDDLFTDQYLVRGLYPDPSNQASRILDEYGAKYHDRQGAKVFIRQAMLVGAMHGFVQATGINALFPGTPGWDYLVLWAMSSLDPKNKTLKRAFEDARQSAIFSPERGIEVGMSPTVRLLYRLTAPEQTKKDLAASMASTKSGRGGVGGLASAGWAASGGARDFLAESFREEIPGMIAMRRYVQNMPDGAARDFLVPDNGAMADMLGVHSYQKNVGLGESVMGNLGLVPYSEAAQRRRPVK